MGGGVLSFLQPFLLPHRWIIASEGRPGPPARHLFSHVKASLNRLPLSVDHLHIHMTPPALPHPFRNLSYPPCTCQTKPLQPTQGP